MTVPKGFTIAQPAAVPQSSEEPSMLNLHPSVLHLCSTLSLCLLKSLRESKFSCPFRFQLCILYQGLGGVDHSVEFLPIFFSPLVFLVILCSMP